MSNVITCHSYCYYCDSYYLTNIHCSYYRYSIYCDVCVSVEIMENHGNRMGVSSYYSRWTKYSNPATRTMLNPPRTLKSHCFSGRVTKSDATGLISFVHWG